MEKKELKKINIGEIKNKIQKVIINLEIVKDNLLDFYETFPELDKNIKLLWISDLKEFYYLLFTIFQILLKKEKYEEEDIKSAFGLYTAFQSRYAQVMSELNEFEDDGVKKSKEILRVEYTIAENLLNNLFRKLLNRKRNRISNDVIEISENHIKINCYVCGDECLSFVIGKRHNSDEVVINYSGITYSTELIFDLWDQIKAFLIKKDLKGLHDFMIEKHTFEGLDAYCPKCDKVYCWNHYSPREVFDQGFYDCTYGTCPEGHRRMIHD